MDKNLTSMEEDIVSLGFFSLMTVGFLDRPGRRQASDAIDGVAKRTKRIVKIADKFRHLLSSEPGEKSHDSEVKEKSGDVSDVDEHGLSSLGLGDPSEGTTDKGAPSQTRACVSTHAGTGKRTFSTLSSKLSSRRCSTTTHLRVGQTQTTGGIAASELETAIRHLTIEYRTMGDAIARMDTLARIECSNTWHIPILVREIRFIEQEAHRFVRCFERVKGFWERKTEPGVEDTYHQRVLNFKRLKIGQHLKSIGVHVGETRSQLVLCSYLVDGPLRAAAEQVLGDVREIVKSIVDIADETSNSSARSWTRGLRIRK